jgi:hypothetical protein
MQFDAFSFARFAQANKLGAQLQRSVPALKKIGVSSLFELRTAAAGSRLQGAGLGPEELKAFESFTSLARIFPAEVALVLLGQGADGPATLARWTEQQFVKALGVGDIADGQAARERQRFALFLSLTRANRPPESLNGLQVDLGDDYDLLSKNAAELTAHGVETLADWAALRGSVNVDPAARQLLDGYTRLLGFSLAPKGVKHLLSQNVDSAVALSQVSDSELQHIAQVGGIQPALLEAARQLAITSTGLLLLDIDDRLRGWEGPITPLWPRPCVNCAENESAFSRFAYYLYLVDKTGKSFHELEITLFHDFSRLTPADGEETSSQVSICNEILQRMLGRNLNADEGFPETRFRVLSILRMAVPRTPKQIVSFLETAPGTAVAADLLPRLVTAYGALPPLTDVDMLNPQPVFTPDEIEALAQVGEALLVQEIKSDPAFAGATPEQISAEMQHKIGQRAQAEIEFLQVIHRAALKQALNRTNRQLFAQLFLETDLPLCERTTRLDQAIRTLQAYIEKNGTSTPAYLSFAAWRGERLGEKYPETTILLRDDVLVGDTGHFDRGSILRNHDVQLQELKLRLSVVRGAVDEARVHAGDSSDELTAALWNTSPKFKDDPAYEYFQRGLTVIDNVLEANDQLYRAASDLDREEPGLALEKLQNAVSLLDRVDGELFANDWFWANQDTSAKRYSELVKVKPATRKERLELQFFNFTQQPKKLFKLRLPDQTLPGLTDGIVVQVGSPSWTASLEFEQRDGCIVKDGTEIGADKFSELRYKQGRNLDNFTFSCEFRARSLWYGHQLDPAQVGIGFRLQDPSAVLSQDWATGYRLAVLGAFEIVGGSSIMHNSVAIQSVNTGGVVTTLSEREVGSSDFTEIEGSSIRKDHWYGLSVTASGGELHGSLCITPEKTILLGPVVDAKFAKGTVSVFVRGSAEVEFRNLNFAAEAPTGVPPFFAPQRAARPIDLRSNLDDSDYWNHLYEAEPMSLDLIKNPLSAPIDLYAGQRQAEVKRDNRDAFLVFPPGGSKVFLDSLDQLLEKCLVLTYYLRFAAIPLRMAQAHLVMGEFQSAADLLHVLYDDDPDDRRGRTIYPFFDRPWFTDFADPGAGAAAMRIRLGDDYLRWAELLFRQNSEASRYEARRLCERALRLHGQENCDCVAQQRQASRHVLALAREARALNGTALAREVLRRDSFVRVDRVGKATTWGEVQALFRAERAEYLAAVKAAVVPEKLRAGAVERLKAAELAKIGIRGQNGAELLAVRSRSAAPGAARIASWSAIYLCTPDNPLVSAQTQEACMMLDMLKSCVNILGYSDDLIPPLRFEALQRVAESFAGLAQAAERDVLQFRQSFEQEEFALMQAQSNLEQADVEVAVEQLNVELAEGEIALAQLQQDQAAAGVATFESLVSDGMSDSELRALAAADAAAQLAAVSAIFSFATMPAEIAAAVATGQPAGAIGAPGQAVGAMGSAFGAQAAALSMRASLERQQQDREFQLQQMRFGLSIALQSVALGFQRWQVAQLQENLAGVRRDFARDALAFLNNRLLSAAGWLMLMKLAREQYRRRLSYAIETSYLAERALAFELQNPSLRIIRFDYYGPRKDGLLGATQLLTDLAQLQSRKLAFQRRKLQLSKTISLAAQFPAAFEQFRQGLGLLVFSTLPEMFDRDFPGHYLRLIQSVRLSVVALVPPTQGIRATLRNTGISQAVVGPPYAAGFETRTIRRTPESISLSAPFQASGLFVLDYKDDLLLPFEGSGVVSDWAFELPKAANQIDFDTIADVLVQIEYTALEGPAAFRAQVLSGLGNTVNADRVYSFRNEFADQWYDLHNPDLVATPQQSMVVKFTTRKEDFPPNLSELRIQHVTLYFSSKSDPMPPLEVTRFLFTEQGQADATGGGATTVNGFISTRQANAGSWTVMLGKSPFGEWELAFPDNLPADLTNPQAPRNRFKNDEIEDILYVVTYRGTTSEWPG